MSAVVLRIEKAAAEMPVLLPETEYHHLPDAAGDLFAKAGESPLSLLRTDVSRSFLAAGVFDMGHLFSFHGLKSAAKTESANDKGAVLLKLRI